ncbi:fibronectin type III domain-containing protein [Sporolactobacillus shoreae]|uniref:Fibronectin type III domain-containing protein n=1 Tax=Sporolactobacillus shoreae TaxID=1465501 RepID=A0A4Z0GGL4_9BACL|nr:fibronectin type III domain-containing protein [Sporolactobacillus shoreae]TGA95713.1 fibronectin type III domain-containing protein [Sporolactobacillus shoreae]
MQQKTYNVYQDGVKIKSGLIDPSFTVHNVQPGSTHQFQVSAQNNMGESTLSDPISVTFPAGDAL